MVVVNETKKKKRKEEIEEVSVTYYLFHDLLPKPLSSRPKSRR